MSELDFKRGVPVAKLRGADLVAGTVDEKAVVLVRHRGRWCGFAGECTHLGGALAEGLVAEGLLRCPLHHARFDLDTGEAVGSPAIRPLDRYRVIEEAGTVRVTGKLELAPPQRVDRDLGRIVIIGSGAAGYACAEMLARHGCGKYVTVLSDDADPPYERTFCSKQYLAGDKSREETAMPAAWANASPPSIRLGVTVSAVSRVGKSVELQTGERVGYDTLVLATGAEPVLPDFDGSDRSDVYLVRTLADADRLIEATRTRRHAIVIGSSFIGLEVAASLRKRGVAVTIVTRDDVPLAKVVGPEIGRMVQALHEENGVVFRFNSVVRVWSGEHAELDDGSIVEADLLVAGTGVKPRLDLAVSSGLALASREQGDGILVDAQLRTSDPAIHAAGDIASTFDQRLGHRTRIEHWLVATRMGQWIARHLLGIAAERDYPDLPYFWSLHYTTGLCYVGHADSPEDLAIHGDVAERNLAVIFREKGTARALLTCGRNLLALHQELAWESPKNRNPGGQGRQVANDFPG